MRPGEARGTVSTAAVQSPIGVRARNQSQRRRRIVQTAAALALRGGVEAMQMRAVAERAGVALGTLYRYFPSKMDLVVAVVTEELDVLEVSIDRRPPAAQSAAGRAVDVLMRATRGLMREPELADALVRSLILSEVKTDLGSRITDLLWRVTRRETAETETGRVPRQASPDEDSAEAIVLSSLVSIWTFELLEILKGTRGLAQAQDRLEIAAERLLAD